MSIFFPMFHTLFSWLLYNILALNPFSIIFYLILWAYASSTWWYLLLWWVGIVCYTCVYSPFCLAWSKILNRCPIFVNGYRKNGCAYLFKVFKGLYGNDLARLQGMKEGGQVVTMCEKSSQTVNQSSRLGSHGSLNPLVVSEAMWNLAQKHQPEKSPACTLSATKAVWLWQSLLLTFLWGAKVTSANQLQDRTGAFLQTLM